MDAIDRYANLLATKVEIPKSLKACQTSKQRFGYIIGYTAGIILTAAVVIALALFYWKHGITRG